MAIICCFTCKEKKELDTRNRNTLDTEFNTYKRLHRCNNPEPKLFYTHPNNDKVKPYFEYVFRCWCANCMSHVTRPEKDAARFWFIFNHSDNNKGCTIQDLRINMFTDWQTKKEITDEMNAEILEDYGATLSDMSKERTLEEGNDQVAQLAKS